MKCSRRLSGLSVEQPPWWDKDCVFAKRTKYRTLRHFRVTNSRRHLDIYKSLRNTFKSLCDTKRKTYTQQRRQLLIDSRKNATNFWKILNDRNNSRKRNVNTVKSEEWYNYFKGLLNQETDQRNLNNDNDNVILNNAPRMDDSNDLNVPISNLEIRTSIDTLHINKSPGPDGICFEMFRSITDIILPFLKELLNKIVNTGDLPDEWGKSIITPVHKSGHINDPNNYRGMSLIDSICKIYMNILSIRLSKWCNKFNIIDESQAGFRRGYSTIDNVFTLMALVQKHISKKKGRFYCIFVDYAKAFDSINLKKLWQAFRRQNIDGKFLLALQSIYAKLKSCVKVENRLTKYFACNIGTRQGCVASPIIF